MNKKELEEYSKSLASLTKEELAYKEQEIINEIDSVNEETGNKTYDLPKENRKEVADSILYLLNKKTVQWQLTLPLVAIYDFWNDEHDEVPHPVIDATLRALGDMTFTGYDEWAQVVAINKYFEPVNKLFAEQLNKIYDLSERHNAIINEIQKNEPIGQQQA